VQEEEAGDEEASDEAEEEMSENRGQTVARRRSWEMKVRGGARR